MVNTPMHITEAQVKELLPVRECVEVLREAFSLPYINIPRYRLKSRNSLLHVMSGSIPDLQVMGLKAYGTSRTAGQFVVLLFSEPDGTVLAEIEADALGQIRTGAASGLATSLLATPEAETAAIIGTGYQAQTQMLAIDSVCKLKEIRIYSRNEANRKSFVQTMQSQVEPRLIASNNAEECVREADIICTITSSRDPVVFGDWLKKGCHINAAGSNWSNKRELDGTAVRRCGLICVDHREQSRIESGDLIQELKPEEWERVVELSDVVTGKARRSSRDEITLFKSNGIAIEDVAAANYIYRKLKEG